MVAGDLHTDQWVGVNRWWPAARRGRRRVRELAALPPPPPPRRAQASQLATATARRGAVGAGHDASRAKASWLAGSTRACVVLRRTRHTRWTNLWMGLGWDAIHMM